MQARGLLRTTCRESTRYAACGRLAPPPRAASRWAAAPPTLRHRQSLANQPGLRWVCSCCCKPCWRRSARACRRRRLRLAISLSHHAFIADEHLWSGDQVFDSMLALAAKRTVQLNFLPHGGAPRLARETNSPAHRIGVHGFNGLRAKSRGYCHRDSTAFTAVPPREIALPKLAGLCSQPAF